MSGGPNGSSEFDCPDEFGYYPHPNDCTQYYVCVFGGALLESCTGGLMYRLETCSNSKHMKIINNNLNFLLICNSLFARHLTNCVCCSQELQTCDWPRNVGCGEPAAAAAPSQGVSTVRVTDSRTSSNWRSASTPAASAPTRSHQPQQVQQQHRNQVFFSGYF